MDADPAGAVAALDEAASLLADGNDPDGWAAWLDATREPAFLTALPDPAARHRWADLAVAALRRADVQVDTLLDLRAAAHPDRDYLRIAHAAEHSAWSFAASRRQARRYAAALAGITERPRVALITPNSVPGALLDLACLAHGFLVTPLSPTLDADTVGWILDRLRIDVLVTGRSEQHQLAERVLEGRAERPAHLVLEDVDAAPAGAVPLDELAADLSAAAVDERLAALPRPDRDALATVMFTSGSTGRPKGVTFTIDNIVSKRFARGAALPTVGRDEVMLCYLPLCHTFGRYLELMGSLYWGGTYVFTGSTSRDTLLALLPEVKPTGQIGIPLRWQQVYARCVETAEARGSTEISPADLRAVVGDRLRWGLSAAGYLEPRIFRFFQRHGVALCSGFGMTEATGGITMTPPDDYVEGSVGLPLPAIETRLSEEGELQIRGPYVGGYLDEDATVDGGWLPTGDIFAERERGHLEIVDRLKDIYKNTRGQTIAPRRVEQVFTEVPGVERAFLVGDHRNDNVLLLVPDADDPVLAGDPQGPVAREYLGRIITAANADLAPAERVVNFAVLPRDFDVERGELTPKGSYRRKAIEAAFAETIEDLYSHPRLRLEVGAVPVDLPRWLHRDLGVIESDIVVDGDALVDRVRGRRLRVARTAEGLVRIGDLEYECARDVIDLGLLARQPRLWTGNAELAAFCPVKEGWDAPMAPFTEHVAMPYAGDALRPMAEDEPFPPATGSPVEDARLLRLHELAARTVHARGETALHSVEALGRILGLADTRTAELIRRRLEVLARHPDMEVRCAAYRVLVLEEAGPESAEVRPKFLDSGLPFLDERSIDLIARGVLEERLLEAFRRRLAAYRDLLSWPADETTRGQFERIFRLLTGFARNQPAFYPAVRDELVSWVLLEEDPAIAARAESEVLRLAEWYEGRMDAEIPYDAAVAWQDRIAFQEGLSAAESARIEEILVGTSFLQQSVLMIDGAELDIRNVPRDGVWVSRTAVRKGQRVYRIAVNTVDDRHFDVLMSVWNEEALDAERMDLLRTIYWMIALSGYPEGDPCVPRFGCWRPELGALSLGFVNELNVWERAREFASDRAVASVTGREPDWRRLLVQALAAVFRLWRNSGERIVPGMITPMNVTVPEPDFRTGARVLSLSGWRPYASTLDLVQPMLRNFHKQIVVNYPWTEKILRLEWIADAAVEALGRERAAAFLSELKTDLEDQPLDGFRGRLALEIDDHLLALRERPRESCALRGAVARFRRWEASTPEASAHARRQQVEEMLRLYGLDREPEIVRYQLYRGTLFRDVPPETGAAFDRLIAALFRRPDRPATALVELSDLQETLHDDVRRADFKRLVFPRSARRAPELKTVDAAGATHLVVQSGITDKKGVAYQVREPVDAAEIGKLYRHFFQAGYYRTISELDRFYVVVDGQERIVGGISWREEEPEVVHLNGIVVATPLLGRGISSVLIEDFCDRMADLGYAVVKTLFVLRPFFERHGFAPDRRWGGLVRMIERSAS